jgi:hypothetical protein
LWVTSTRRASISTATPSTPGTDSIAQLTAFERPSQKLPFTNTVVISMREPSRRGISFQESGQDGTRFRQQFFAIRGFRALVFASFAMPRLAAHQVGGYEFHAGSAERIAAIWFSMSTQ